MSPSVTFVKSTDHILSNGRAASVHLPLTRGGRVKRRLTFDEKLRILDPTSAADVTLERLMAFMNLFSFRTTGGIITRAGGGPRAWSALWSEITTEHVARHLLADRLLPVFEPQWVGSRSPSTTKVVTVDVDADRAPNPILTNIRGLSDIHLFGYRDLDQFLADLAVTKAKARRKVPFSDRCLYLEQALRRLGIEPDDPRQVLKQPTPSGGLHYIIFLDRPYFLYQIHDLLIRAGLRHVPGQIEFFPSKNRAIRLPFGHVPGQPHDPRAWIRFVEDYLGGRTRLYSLEGMYDRLRCCPIPSPDASANHQFLASRTSQGAPSVSGMSPVLGQPSAQPHHSQVRSRTASSPEEDLDRYIQLIENPITSFADAEELFNLGILVPGTRTAALNRLAAHFIWFRHLSAEEATEALTGWALDPRHRSKDIQADLDDGTDKVAKQIACMCLWYERTKKSVPPADRPELDPRARFAHAELDALMPAIQSVPVSERTDQAHFFLNFLAFAKTHGRAKDQGSGWEVAVAINAVVRKWPGCRGKDKYKTRMDRAKDSGLLAMTKDKWQRPGGNGRARTYLLSVPCVDRTGWTISYPDALARLTDPTAPPEAVVHPVVIENAMPRSPADEQSHEPTCTPAIQSPEDADPRPVRPGGAGGSVGPRPPQCPSEPAPVEAVPHRVDAAVPAVPASDDPGSRYAVAGGAGSARFAPMTGDTGQTIADAVPFVGVISATSELSPRLKVIFSKPLGHLSFKESRQALEFLSRQQHRGAVIPGGVIIRLRQKAKAYERTRSS